MNKTWLRIILDIIIALAVINGWWFMALPLGIVGAWSFSYYAELFLAGVFYDGLFGFDAHMGVWAYAGTIVSLGVLFVVSAVKRTVR